MKEEILDKEAHKYMLQWNTEGFKKSHPSLYKGIMESMESYASERVREACKAQREECERAYYMHDRLENTLEAILAEGQVIRNAPEPKQVTKTK